MNNLSRRTVLGTLAATTVSPLARAQRPLPAKLTPRPSKSIAASPISIGFETLDRRMFDPERTYALLGQLGVKWARCQTGWARTETRAGEFDFTWLDRVVDQLLAVGVQPWFNLGYGNRLYTKGVPHESAVGWAPIFTAEAQQAWERYVDRIAARFRDRVTHWEIWNEPNIVQYWQPQPPNAAEYTRLVRLTAPIIRRQVPKAVLIGGAYAGIPESFPYIESCLEAGLGQLVDRISFHPYRSRLELNYAQDIRALQALLRRHNPALRLWQGENGAPSQPKSFGALGEMNWTEPAQARWLLRRLLSDLALGVEVTSYFLIVDLANYVTAQGLDGRTNFKGVLRATDYTPKPSYQALQNLCALFDSETTPADHLIRFNGSQGVADEAAISSAAFTRRGVPLYAYWYPSSLPDNSISGTTRVSLFSGRTATLETPVMVNLLDGAVTKLERVERRNGFLHLPGMPLLDHPLVLTDASVIA